MQPDDTHWLEACLAALAAALGWCWRLAVKDNDRQRRIEQLEQWREAHMEEYCKMNDVLMELRLQTERQEGKLNHISKDVGDIKRRLDSVLRPIPGGNRIYDPPLSGGGA